MRRGPRSQPGRGASCSGPSQPQEADEAPPAFRRRAGEGTERERVWWRRPSGGRGGGRETGRRRAPEAGAGGAGDSTTPPPPVIMTVRVAN